MYQITLFQSPAKPQLASIQPTPDGTNTVARQVLANGQQTQSTALMQAVKAKVEINQAAAQQQQLQLEQAQQTQTVAGDANKQFVVTPDYIQQSMFVYQPSVIVYNPNCTYPLQNDVGCIRYYTK